MNHTKTINNDQLSRETEMIVSNITEIELKQLENAKTSSEWQTICDEIKEKRNGEWPSDWAKKVIFGNLKTKLDLSMKIIKVVT